MPVPFSWGELSDVSTAGQSNIWPLNSFIYKQLFSCFHHSLKEIGRLKYLIHFFFLLQIPLHKVSASLVAQVVKNPTSMQETLVRFLGKKAPWRRDRLPTPIFMGFPGGSDGKESAYNAGDMGSIPGLGRSPWRRAWLPTPVFLPGESPWTEEPGGLQSMRSQRVSHDWTTKLGTALHKVNLKLYFNDDHLVCWPFICRLLFSQKPLHQVLFFTLCVRGARPQQVFSIFTPGPPHVPWEPIKTNLPLNQPVGNGIWSLSLQGHLFK